LIFINHQKQYYIYQLSQMDIGPIGFGGIEWCKGF
jgi:hypothetical protein